MGFFADEPGLFDGGLDNRSSIEAVPGRLGGFGGPPPGGPGGGGPDTPARFGVAVPDISSAVIESARDDLARLKPPSGPSSRPIGAVDDRGMPGGGALPRGSVAGGGAADDGRGPPVSGREACDGEAVCARGGGGGAAGNAASGLACCQWASQKNKLASVPP